MLSKSKEKHWLRAYFNTGNPRDVPAHLSQFGAPDADTSDEELFFITRYVAAIDRVFLRNSLVTEAGLRLLKKLQGVTYLDLRGTPLHDDNLDCILHFCDLAYLDVQRTGLSPRGVGQLLRAFSRLDTLLAQLRPEDAHWIGVWERAFPRCELIVSLEG